MSEMRKGAWYVNQKTGERRTLESWGEKNVTLGMGNKAIAAKRIARSEFEANWELEA
jgi:hypothetical protein